MTNEPVFDLVRFRQACNRLEVMRGISESSNKLMIRLLRKYSAVNVRDGIHNFRLVDLGPTQ